MSHKRSRSKLEGDTKAIQVLLSQKGPRAVVPAYFNVQLKYGVQHALVLSAAPGGTTTSDFNDFFTAVLHY